jgi:hypothetical protein
MAAEQPQTPPANEGEGHSFAAAKVTFAVDRSGSTHGRPLQCELRFIRRISQLFSAESQSSATVVPWDHQVERVVSLQNLDSITSRGGTQPSSILMNPVAAAAVSNSSLWFLMTDGLVSDKDQESFANLVPRTGIHGIACIPVIFGTTSRPVAYCNISVGVSLFSVCPNALFLYFNTVTEEIIVMQTKGVFNSLLNGAENPVISNATSWTSFPRLNLASLSDVIIPTPKKLSADQVALQGSLVVNFDDLWTNRLSKSQVDQIFSNADNLNTITMAAQSRGAQANRQFQSWVQMQAMPTVEPLRRPRGDVKGEARATFLELIRLAKDNKPLPPPLQERLRRAHITNMKSFIKSCEQHNAAANTRNAHVRQSYKKSTGRVTSANALNSAHSTSWDNVLISPPSRFTPSGPRNVAAPAAIPVDTFAHSRLEPPSTNPTALQRQNANENPRKRPKVGTAEAPAIVSPDESFQVLACLSTESQLQQLLYTPGFRSMTGSFRGECTICGLKDATLAWLFKGDMLKAPTGMSNALATGASTTADITSSLVCCEPCSTYCVTTGQSLLNETIVAALPMVRCQENMESYQQGLRKVLQGSHADNIHAFLSIIINKDMKMANEESGTLFHNAVTWTAIDLAMQTTTGQQGQPPTLAALFDKLAEGDATVTSQPLEAFIVMLRTASFAGVSVDKLQAGAYKRYLFCLTEAAGSALAKAAVQGNGNEILQSFIKNLWQDNADEEEEDPDLVVISSARGSPESRSSRTRVLDLSMAALRGTPFLSEETFTLMDGMEEFRVVGHQSACATAVFLHALMDVIEKHNYSTPWELFKLVQTRKELAPVFTNPEAVDVQSVADMLKALKL